jgi:hypothetical protein
MKSTLEFSLPEEQDDLKDALNGWKLKMVISEALGLIRNKLKYESPSKAKSEAYEEVRDLIIQEIQDRDLSYILD